MTKTFNEYMLTMLLEHISNNEVILLFSNRLKTYLKTINHPISKKLLSKESSSDFKVKKTYIDLDDNGVDTVSFITSSKASQMIITSKRKDNSFIITDDMYGDVNRGYGDVDVYSKNRSTIKINKLVNQLFPNEFKPSGDSGNDMESFVNLFKSGRDISVFEIVDGEDIKHWYNENQHKIGIKYTTLGKSCMRYDNCSDFLEFYSVNKDNVSLVILKDNIDNTKIRGRAILWKLKLPSNRMFMDRIYQSDEFIVDIFKEYAKENGWLYKSIQSMNEEEEIFDPIKNTSKKLRLEVTIDNYTDFFPYMDTMKYYDPLNRLLSNSDSKMEEDRYYLEQDNGDYFSDTDKEFQPYYNEYIDIDGDFIYCELGDGFRKPKDAIWSTYYSSYITNEYKEEHMKYCKYGNEYRKIEDAVFLPEYDEYATSEYLKNDIK